jgi:anti-sigma-K factor RskA
MSMDDDLDSLAGEYVLGTLDASERAMVAARRQREPDLDRAIRDWERRLGPLAETVPSVAPPTGTFEAIEARLAPASSTTMPANDNIEAMRRQLRRWRGLAVAAGSIAAALMIFVGVTQVQRVQEPQSFVAVLQKDSASPAFLVSVDLASRSLSVTPVAAERQADKDYELWLVSDQFPAPRSLGVLRQDGFTQPASLKNVSPEAVRDGVLAVSLEPAGGSKTGVPTGPVLFTGKLIAQGI